MYQMESTSVRSLSIIGKPINQISYNIPYIIP